MCRHNTTAGFLLRAGGTSPGKGVVQRPFKGCYLLLSGIPTVRCLIKRHDSNEKDERQSAQDIHELSLIRPDVDVKPLFAGRFKAGILFSGL